MLLAFAALAFFAQSDSTSPPSQVREVNITVGSTSGWIPSEALEESARQTAIRFHALIEKGEDDAAYAMLTPGLQQMMSPTVFAKQNRHSRSMAGKLKVRAYTKLTWTKDAPGMPEPGVFAAIDEVAKFDKVDRHCGYLILHQAPGGGPFRIARMERVVMSNDTAKAIAEGEGPGPEEVWAKATASCPNYRALP